MNRGGEAIRIARTAATTPPATSTSPVPL